MPHLLALPQLHLVPPAVLREVCLQQGVPVLVRMQCLSFQYHQSEYLVCVDVDVSGLEPGPHVRGEPGLVAVVIRPHVVQGGREQH